jgi:hypothetical protein
MNRRARRADPWHHVRGRGDGSAGQLAHRAHEVFLGGDPGWRVVANGGMQSAPCALKPIALERDEERCLGREALAAPLLPSEKAAELVVDRVGEEDLLRCRPLGTALEDSGP